MKRTKFFRRDVTQINTIGIRRQFVRQLEQNGVIDSETIAAKIFKADQDREELGVEVVCPFPLISSVKCIYRHAKKIKKALKQDQGISLGKCQMILAKTYGHTHWTSFSNAVADFFDQGEVVKAKRVANAIQKALLADGTSVKLKYIRNNLQHLAKLYDEEP